MPTANQIKMAKVRAARGKPKKQKGGCDGSKSCAPCQSGEGPKIDALKKVGRAVADVVVKGTKLAIKHRKDIAKGIRIAGTVGKAIAPKIKVFDFAESAADVIGAGQKGGGISQRSKFAGKNTGMLTDPTASQGVGGMTAITGRLTF